MGQSGYHPLKYRPDRIVFGWYTVDIIVLRIILSGYCSYGAQWISSSLGSSCQDCVCMVHSGYHSVKDRPIRIVFVWWTVDIIPLRFVLAG